MIDIYRIKLAGPPTAGCADDALRVLLAARLGGVPELVRGPHGKPEIAGGELAFSVAHSGALALIAITTAAHGPIGVDVEQLRELRDPAAFARRFFTAAEGALVIADPAQLYRLWCRKEAWLKAQGTGLRLPLDALDVRVAPAGWLLADLDVAPGYAAAVACAGADHELRVHDFAQ